MAEITAKELAERLGISTAAVSFALNGKSGVSEETRARVLSLAQQLGYTHTRLQNSSPECKTICFLIYVGQIIRHAENTSFYSLVLRGAETASAEYGYQTVVRYLYADKPMEQQLRNILNGVHGIILLATDVNEDCLPDVERFILSAGEIPTVVVNNALLADRVDCVVSDNFGGAKSAVWQLIERGCTKIGYLASKGRIEPFRQRERGVLAALREAGLRLHSRIELEVSTGGAMAEIEQWLETGRDLPDGVFADNDVLAAAAIHTLQRHGVEIPKQVAIIGFDNNPVCEICEPQLSSVQAFPEQMGYWASRIISKRLESKKARYDEPLLRITVSTPLHVRQSSEK